MISRAYLFASVIILAGLSFLGYALHLNKDEIVLEVIKAAIFILAGGAGGYALKRSGKPPHPGDDAAKN
jgi:hypothetical protein